MKEEEELICFSFCFQKVARSETNKDKKISGKVEEKVRPVFFDGVFFLVLFFMGRKNRKPKLLLLSLPSLLAAS